MDTIQRSQGIENSDDIQELQAKIGLKRKRQCSQSPTDGDQLPPPQKKTTPCDGDEKQKTKSIDETKLNNGNGPNGDVQHHEIDDCHYSLLHLCDEVLYEIFKFLDTWSLMTLMNVSKRFQSFVLDRRLWENIDLSQEPLPLGILEDMLERSHEKTRTIKLRGPAPSQHIEGEIRHFNKTLRNSLTTRCTNLKTLELFGVTLDFTQLAFKDFPSSLKRLVLSNCHVRIDTNMAIFTAIETILINLEELAIEQNAWFDPYYVVPIAKLPILKYLSLKGCTQMEDFVPYGSIAGRHGFKKLEILDLRETPLNDSDLQSFNALENLKEIYLQCPQENKSENKIPLNNEASTSGSSTDEDTKNTEQPSTSSNNKPGLLTGSTVSTNSSSEPNVDKCKTAGFATPSSVRPIVPIGSISPEAKTSATASVDESPSTSASASKGMSSCIKTTLPALAESNSDNSTASCETSPSKLSISPSVQNNANVQNLQADNDNNDNANNNNSVNAIVVVGTNNPPRSRFLPRPDHIIYVDCRNRASPHAFSMSVRAHRMALQQQQQQQQSPPPAFEQVMRHNLFWDIINPLGQPLFGNRLHEEHMVELGPGAAANPHNAPFHVFCNTRSRGSISDRGVCCFGRTRDPVPHGIIWIRLNNRPSENRFERFSIRDYKSVTDTSLEHLVQCSPHLVFLDVSGTSITLKGIQMFKTQKPECKVVAEHLLPVS